MNYARIQDGIVVEIIEAFVTTDAMRPPMPAPFAEGHVPTADEQRIHDAAVAAHNDFFVGEVPIEQRFTPEFVATLVPIEGGANPQQGWHYAAGVFSAPPPYVPPPMTAAEAIAQKAARIAVATSRIAPLQDMVDLGEATPDEEAELLAWKRYRIALTRLTSTSPGWPSSLTWPVEPDHAARPN